MQVRRLLRRIDHLVLGAPRKVYPPDEVKPKWLRSARDEVASLRADLEGLGRRVEALEDERAADRAGGRPTTDGIQGR